MRLFPVVVLFGAVAAIIGARWVGSPAVDRETQPNSEADGKAEKFLEWVESILNELPTDGQFGISRVPRLHGTDLREGGLNRPDGALPKNQNFQELSKDYLLWFQTWSSSESADTMRVRRWGEGKGGDAKDALQFYKTLYGTETKKKILDFLGSHKKSGRLTLTSGSHKMTMNLRAIYASSEKCYSCHTNVKKGDPIGVVTLTRVQQ